jgi:RNase P/RNase MRP subunit p29
MKTHQQPFIGKEATIIASDNASHIGISGVIQDETKNTITINGKKLAKNNIIFTIDGKTIRGTTITKTITERIKVHKT